MNLLRLKALIWKESYRFLKVWLQTLLSPVIVAIMYFSVFGAVLGDHINQVSGTTYSLFILPGLALLQSTAHAFQNPSSSIIIAKYNGSITDILLPPISALESTLGFMFGGVIRGFLVNLVIFFIAGFFVDHFIPFSLPYFFIMLFLAHAIFALIGTIVGLWAKTFDQTTGIQSFIITPVTFLGGVFYSLEMLPAVLQKIALFNPFLYLVDGLRWGFLGVSEIDPLINITISLGIFLLFFTIVYIIFLRGYFLKN